MMSHRPTHTTTSLVDPFAEDTMCRPFVSTVKSSTLINQCNGNRLSTLLGLDYPHPDLLALAKYLNSGSLDDGDVKEHIFAVILGGDKA